MPPVIRTHAPEGRSVRDVEIPLFEIRDPESRSGETRTRASHSVRFRRFPRTCGESAPRSGTLRDQSENGLCLRADRPERVGQLLEVDVRSGVDQPAARRIARVAWARAAGDGEHWLGLRLLEARGNAPLRIRFQRAPARTRSFAGSGGSGSAGE